MYLSRPKNSYSHPLPVTVTPKLSTAEQMNCTTYRANHGVAATLTETFCGVRCGAQR